MNRRGKIFLGVAIFLFVGITIIGLFALRNIEQSIYNMLPEEVEIYGMNMLDDITNRRYEETINSFVEELRDQPIADSQIEEMSVLFDETDEYVGRDIAGYQWRMVNGVTTHEVTYELEYKNGYVLYTFVLTDKEGELKAYSVNFNLTETSLKEQNGFNFDNRGIVHVIVLLLTVASLAFSIITASICFGSDKKNRILWSLFALSGVGALSFVWTTGLINFNLITIGIPTGGLGKSGVYAPFVLSMRFPLGAILYWLIKHKEVVEVETNEIQDVDVLTSDMDEDTSVLETVIEQLED